MSFLRAHWANALKKEKAKLHFFPYVKEFSWDSNHENLNLVITGPTHGRNAILFLRKLFAAQKWHEPEIYGPEYTPQSVSLFREIANPIPGRPYSPEVSADALF
jgi:hypothetical protein